MYGEVPPDAVTVADPLAPPLQLTLVCAVMVADTCAMATPGMRQMERRENSQDRIGRNYQ